MHKTAMDTPEDLQFQEFQGSLLSDAPPDTSAVSLSGPTTEPVQGGVAIRLDLSEDEEDQEDNSMLLGGEEKASGFWTFEYYQTFFNVDTMQVLNRIRASLMPLPGRNFIKYHLHKNPDLYGPFWICGTLVFSLAISGNISTFLSQMGDPRYHYRPQFNRVTVAAVVVFLYAWLMPLCLWGFLKWRQGTERQTGGYSYLETVCVYGYSLFIYIPTSVLWIIPLEWLRWVFILIAMAISGSVLAITFWPVVRDDTRAAAITTMVAIVLLHALLALGCKMFFFQTDVYTVTPTASPAPSISNHTALLNNTVRVP